MKIIQLFFFLALFATANAQDPITDAITDDSATYLVRLVDNTSLTGKILERTETQIVFLDLTVGKVNIPIKKIVKLTQLSNDQLCILTTNDGKTFTGLLISHTDEELILRTESLGDLTIANSKIRDIKLIEKEQMKDGKFFFDNPHPTRYFFGPSAIPMKKGEGYYQNAYILANSVQFGVSDNFSMGGGIVIPLLFFITPKVGFKLNDIVYVGGGVLAATTLSNDNFAIAVAYGTLTLGNTENSFTINAGWGGMKEETYTYDPITTYPSSKMEWQPSKSPMFSLSGMTRIAPQVALITENWFFTTKEYDYDEYNYNAEPSYNYGYRSVLSFGIRLLGEKNSFDIALLVPAIGDFTMGIPYIDYVFKF